MKIKVVLVDKNNKILWEIPQEALIEQMTGRDPREALNEIVEYLRKKSGEL